MRYWKKYKSLYKNYISTEKHLIIVLVELRQKHQEQIASDYSKKYTISWNMYITV